MNRSFWLFKVESRQYLDRVATLLSAFFYSIITIILSFVLCSEIALASPPQPDVMVKVEKATVILKDKNGSIVQLDIKLNPVKNTETKNINLDVQMFDYINGIESRERTVLSQKVSAAIPLNIPVRIRIAGEGTYVIQAKIAGGQSGFGFSHINRAYLISNQQEEISLISAAKFKHQENRANIRKLTKNPRLQTEGVPLDGWFLTVAMQIKYLDASGNTMPLPKATVEIWEDDIFIDDYLGKVALDSAGSAAPTVLVPYDPLGPDDIYLVVKTQNANLFTLGTASQPSKTVTPYQFQNSNTRVTTGEGQVDINFTIKNGVRELGVWSLFNNVRNYITTQLNFTPKAFNIWFPASGQKEAYFQRALNLIAIGDNYAMSDQVIAHEFGHDFMWQINNEWLPEAGGSHSICPEIPIDNKLAWTEGYATAFALSSTHSTDGVFHWTPGDRGLSVEHYSCDYYDLETDEIRVAAAIWDFVDTDNDCNDKSQKQGRSGFCDQNQHDRISSQDAYYNAVKGQQQETTMPYWWYLYDNFMNTNQQSLAEDIMKYNWSKYTNPVINSFSCRCVDTPERCLSGVYDFMCYWSVTAHSAQTSVSINGSPWKVRSTQLVGGTGGIVNRLYANYAIKLLGQGWGTAQQILYEPPIILNNKVQGFQPSVPKRESTPKR